MTQRPAFWHATVLAVSGHAAVLAWLGTLPPAPAPQGVQRPAAMVFQLRAAQVMDAPPAPPMAAVAAPEAAVRPPAPEVRRTVPPQPPATPGTEAVAAAAPAAPVADAPYLPRGELTVPPRLVGSLDVPFPDDITGVVSLQVRLTLFIDERGTVQRIRVDTPGVHPSFERSIRESFGAAKFTPGELERVAVRSQLRLEVEFHAPGGRRS